jgi:hypothetical protein
MPRTKRWILLALTLGIASCSDTSGPPIESDGAVASASRTSLNHLKWDAGAGGLQFGAELGTPSGVVTLMPEWGVLADVVYTSQNEYQTSFWAVRGEHRYLQINRVRFTDAGYVISPFLRLDITDPVELPDGTPIAVGDSVLISVSVDMDYLVADLQPSGIQFGTANPTILKMWYTGAGSDLNGDGVVSDYDMKLQKQMLGMWVQEKVSDPWDLLDAQHALDEKSFSGLLEHFSEYAISW